MRTTDLPLKISMTRLLFSIARKRPGLDIHCDIANMVYSDASGPALLCCVRYRTYVGWIESSRTALASRSPGGTIMQWTTPAYTDMRFGFEITLYIATR
jgi:coenzyme PQQ precursor peptide PqqA